jgi:hypothetical protein
MVDVNGDEANNAPPDTGVLIVSTTALQAETQDKIDEHTATAGTDGVATTLLPLDAETRSLSSADTAVEPYTTASAKDEFVNAYSADLTIPAEVIEIPSRDAEAVNQREANSVSSHGHEAVDQREANPVSSHEQDDGYIDDVAADYPLPGQYADEQDLEVDVRSMIS